MLELEAVTAGYGTRAQVLHEVTIDVPDGKCVALLGPNGAGKSTLLRTASRMLPLQSGTMRLADTDISRFGVHEVSALGMCHIPEGRGIFPALTVRDNLALFGSGLSVKDSVARATEAFPFIERRIDTVAGSLSGGERQMLALSRAWLTKPKIVLLDEVSMGLAPLIVDEVYAFIRRLAGEGISLLVVEQYVDRVKRFADHIYLMRNGAIRYSGAASGLESDEEVLGHYLGAALHEDHPHDATTNQVAG